MTESFRIEQKQLEDRTKETDDRMQSAISIWLNGICLTELEDRTSEIKLTRRFMRVSALQLADWFAGNWWRLRWEPKEEPTSTDWQMSHNLAAAGSGYLWPNLILSSDGETIQAIAKSDDPNSTEPVRYLQNYEGIISAIDFEKAIDNFVNAVINDMPPQVKTNTELTNLWAEVSWERANEYLKDIRKLEARLGYDPGKAPNTLMSQLLEQRRVYGADAIQEIAVASKERSLDHLEFLEAEVRNRDETVQLPNCNEILAEYQAQTNALDTPWRRGEKAAGIARLVWGIASDRVETRTLNDLFGVNLNRQHQSDLPLSAGLRDCDNSNLRIALHQRSLTGRRFTLARVVADQITTPTDERLLPATNSRTSRQKFQRAFARELLCPTNDLLKFIGNKTPGDDQIDDAAEHFQVSDRLIRFTLINKGIIENKIPEE